MQYGCSIYGLGVLANRPIPTVPRSTITTTDVRVSFGVLPDWFDALEPHQIETTYVTDYAAACGTPALVFSRLHGGKFYRFSYADKTEFVVDEAGREIWSDWPEPLTLEDASTYLLGPVMGFVLLLRGLVCLHASAIVVDGQAIAMVGPAGAGKSTTAAAFAARGFNVLAEDVVTLDDRFGDRGDSFFVRPAYPCIRLWPASAATLYGSSSALPPLTPNWDKCYLDLTRGSVLESKRFENTPRELAALYLLGERRGDLRAPFVEPLEPAEGLMSLVANTYATKLMDKHMRAREFDLLSRLLSRVPLRRVTPHSDSGRLSNLCDRILSDFNALDV
ncbi:MAG: serine/threonine protein kinase [Pyrinomonadaceae bacterium]